jgi:hypothetical protein
MGTHLNLATILLDVRAWSEPPDHFSAWPWKAAERIGS